MGSITVGWENSAPVELDYEDHGNATVVVRPHRWPPDNRSAYPVEVGESIATVTVTD